MPSTYQAGFHSRAGSGCETLRRPGYLNPGWLVAQMTAYEATPHRKVAKRAERKNGLTNLQSFAYTR